MRFLPSILLAAALPAWATNVMVIGVTGTHARVLVNASKVHVLQVGEVSREGVKLIDVKDGIAVLQFDGRVHRLGEGDATVSEVSVRLGPDGGYRTTVRLNEVAFPALIDTGASVVSMTTAHARQLGLDYRAGRRAVAQTANGPVDIYLVTLPSVEVGGIRLTNVLASVVVGTQAAQRKEVLIGNSFLSQVQLQRRGDTLVLRKH